MTDLKGELGHLAPHVAPGPWAGHEYVEGYAVFGLPLSSGHVPALVAPGTVFFERMKMMGKVVEIIATLRALRPPTGYDYDAISDGLTGGGTMTLRDLGNGSVEFHVDIDLNPTTLPLRIVTALFGWKFRAAERARLARTRELLASGALVPPAA